MRDGADAGDRLRRSETLERTMLALRDAREAFDVLGIVARSLAHDFKRPCVAFYPRDGIYRAVSGTGDRTPEVRRTFDLEALRVRGTIRRGSDDIVAVGTDGQVRALFVLEDGRAPLGDEDLKYLRTLCAHVALALSNAHAFEQLRRHAAEGAALTEAARTILGYSELAPLASSLCRLGTRLVVAETASVYVRRGDAFDLEACSTSAATRAPATVPGGLALARRALASAFGETSLTVTPIATSVAAEAAADAERGLIVFTRARPFDRADLRLIDTLVTLAALAFRNVDLFEAATDAARALAESNAFKDDLMAMFAHDFKGPLTVISGYSELLFDSDDPGVRRSAQTIVEQTRRLAKLSDDALALAATQSAGFSLQRTIEDMTAFVRAVAVPLDRAGNRIALQAPPEPVLVSFDRSRLRHVIDNVVGNALKYSTGTVEIAIARERGNVCVSVSDRGIGIPQDELDAVFSRFGRGTNARSKGIAGSGVGLYIAKKIVDVHDGRLLVRSVENEGSTFSLVLPA
ncbi:MAG: hypothetical protein NVSMB21_11970 [Vulcanimicrobiaceae bacterium]